MGQGHLHKDKSNSHCMLSQQKLEMQIGKILQSAGSRLSGMQTLLQESRTFSA